MKENAELPKSSMKYKPKKNRKNRSPFSYSPVLIILASVAYPSFF